MISQFWIALRSLAYLPSQNPLKSDESWAGRFWQPNPGLAGTGRNGALGIVDLFLSTFEHILDHLLSQRSMSSMFNYLHEGFYQILLVA